MSSRRAAGANAATDRTAMWLAGYFFGSVFTTASVEAVREKGWDWWQVAVMVLLAAVMMTLAMKPWKELDDE